MTEILPYRALAKLFYFCTYGIKKRNRKAKGFKYLSSQ
jgi:hypothetical protein